MAKKLAAKAAPTPAVETRSFTTHPRILVDIIKRQAGDLHKAVLEGVMNAVDAKAAEIHITLTDKQLVITDNGEGITDKEKIYNCWETFGQPPEENEKKTYGYFRMGRGQLFAFGKNRWETGPFTMICDIEKTGLNYDLHESTLNVTHGCHIVIDLYRPLKPTEIARMRQELEHSIKYVPALITFNDETLTVPTNKVKWDDEIPEAYIKLKETGTLAIYNLGVLVCYFPQHKFGCGGEVVSRKQLKVNFARNEVMADCPVWANIKPLVYSKADNKIERQPALNDGSRQRIADQMIANDIEEDKATNSKVITDVTGRHWSLSGLFASCWGHKISSTTQGDRKGDRLMQLKMTFVVGQATLDRFRVNDLPALLAILSRHDRGKMLSRFEVVPFDSASSGISNRMDLIPEKEWSPLEEFIFHVLRTNLSHLYGYPAAMKGDKRVFYDDYRRLRLGMSDAADAWTDGESYIAINRDYVRSTGYRNGAWALYAAIIVHELCHEEDDLTSHVHGPEFYEKFHEWMQTDDVRDFTEACIASVPRIAKNIYKRVPVTQLKQQDRVVLADRALAELEQLSNLNDPPVVSAKVRRKK